ncbi:hypothetical protein [Dietzia sp. 179-F 9C3 NHS]|uniref:hypothetical protein n=1 Tax=Dietzia sp. 179-F 9C3 NHS TaxID=3374295 RepID=UPI0038790E37
MIAGLLAICAGERSGYLNVGRLLPAGTAALLASLYLSGPGCAALVLAVDRGAGPDGVRAVWHPGAT